MADKDHGASPTTPPSPRVLVDRRSDPWLLGGFAIVAWLLLSAPAWGGPDIPVIASGPFYWFLLALSGTHFGASYHLPYGLGRAKVRRHWFALIAVPAVLVAASVAIATGILLVYRLPRILSEGTEETAVATVPAALLFVLFNLHHYAVDATIWRTGGEHIRRIVRGGDQPTAPGASLVSSAR